MKSRFLPMILVFLLGVKALAIPEGVLVREEKKGDCCDARLEITPSGEAYYLENHNLMEAALDDVGGALHVEVEGNTRWILTRNDETWTDQENGRWVKRETMVKIDPAWTDVLIHVTDQHGDAIDDFDFTYRIESKDGTWDPLLVRPIPANAGQVQLKAPDDCSIVLRIEHPDFVRGYNSPQTLERRNGVRGLKVTFERARTARGKVVADESGLPLAGVEVSPMIFTPPLFSPDRERTVKTAADGSFELRGVDMGFMVEHPQRLEEQVFLEEGKDQPVEVRLKTGLSVTGKVMDPSGKPLAEVEVSDGTGKRALTDKNGGFELQGLRKWRNDRWALEFSKEGFNDSSFEEAEVGPGGLEIQLLPLPELRGRVVLSDGRPVGRFTVICGPGPSPADFECEVTEVESKDGRFTVRPDSLPDEGDGFWLGIRAEGAAPWEGVATQSVLQSGDFEIKLLPGVSLTAKLALPGKVNELEIRLEPVDRDPEHSMIVCDHPGKALASSLVRAKRTDRLHLPNLRPGEYVLKIIAKGATPLLLPVAIGNSDVDLGELKLAGTGSIRGVVNDPQSPGKPWSFTDGEIGVAGFGEDGHEPFMTFKTDREGRFQVDGVPVGKVSVAFPYNVTADIIDALVRTVVVNEGQTTEVRFEGEGGAWAQPLKFLFAERETIPAAKGTRVVENVTDREPMFRIEVASEDGSLQTASEEWTHDADSAPVIPDLSPGRWRIRVFDWLGSRGFDEGLRAEVVADVRDDRTPITVRLGDRMLSGRVTSARETKRMIQVIAVGRSSGRVFLSRADDEGDFVIRYLPEDDYFVHARDDDGGWCDLGSKRADGPITDFGEHALADGGHVTGTIPREVLLDEEGLSLSARSPDGLEFPVDEWEDDGSYRFGHLRPGAWTITGRSGAREFLRCSVDVRKGIAVKAE